MSLKSLFAPAHGVVVLIVLSSAEGSGEPVQICRLDRAFTSRINGTRIASNVVTLSSDEGKGDPVQKLLISYFYITKSILISQNALDFVISHTRFCDIKNRICY